MLKRLGTVTARADDGTTLTVIIFQSQVRVGPGEFAGGLKHCVTPGGESVNYRGKANPPYFENIDGKKFWPEPNSVL